MEDEILERQDDSTSSSDAEDDVSTSADMNTAAAFPTEPAADDNPRQPKIENSHEADDSVDQQQQQDNVATSSPKTETPTDDNPPATTTFAAPVADAAEQPETVTDQRFRVIDGFLYSADAMTRVVAIAHRLVVQKADEAWLPASVELEFGEPEKRPLPDYYYISTKTAPSVVGRKRK